MKKDTVVDIAGRATAADTLTELLRNGAQELIRQAVEAELQELLEQRHAVDDSHHCPHGRPTSLMLSRGTLDKQFGRLG